MAEYIEREAAVKRLLEMAETAGKNRLYYEQECMETSAEVISGFPAADVAPVVHGRWYMRGGRACCSNCNIKALWKSDWDGDKNHEREFVSAKSNYCPNCGAKMDEEEKDGNKVGF